MVPNARVLGERRAGPPPRSLLELQRPDVLRPACPPFGFLIAAANCAFQDFILGRQDEKGERERNKAGKGETRLGRFLTSWLAPIAALEESCEQIPLGPGPPRRGDGALLAGRHLCGMRVRGAPLRGPSGLRDRAASRRTGGAAGLRCNGSRRNAGERGPSAP